MATTQTQHEGELCLACGEETQLIAVKRGLCLSCYEKLRRVKEKKSPDDQAKLEAYLVREGKLLPDKRVADNVFVRAMKAVESLPPLNETVDEVDGEVGSKVNKRKAASKSKQPNNVSRKRKAN